MKSNGFYSLSSLITGGYGPLDPNATDVEAEIPMSKEFLYSQTDKKIPMLASALDEVAKRTSGASDGQMIQFFKLADLVGYEYPESKLAIHVEQLMRNSFGPLDYSSMSRYG